MDILITGGAGFIGSNLTANLLEKGHRVTVVDSLITGTEENLKPLAGRPQLSFVKGDVAGFDFSKLGQFDTAFHLASPASPVQYKKYPVETMMANSAGTCRLLEYVKNGGAKSMVMASTSETYGDPLIHPQTEEYWGNVNPVGIRACYDESKRFAEAACSTYHRQYGLDVRIARIFNTYGPNMEKNDGRVVSNFIVQCLTGQPVTVYGDGKQTRSFCFVSDMVEGLTLLGTVPGIGGQVVNLGNPEERTMVELAQTVIKLTGSKSEITYTPIDQDDPKKRKPDIAKARKLLGWNPAVPLETGLAKTIAYFKQRFINL